jgi:D-alanyl-D-alanine carboxypeptidase-like protein
VSRSPVKHAKAGIGVSGLLVLGTVVLMTSAASAAARTGDPPRFEGHATRIDDRARERMTGVSWRPGCPVGFADLRLLRVSHWGFNGGVHRGRLVVHRDAAAGMLRVMRRLYRLRFPIRQMRLVDAYSADDRSSMAADNTSAFNCRTVAGQPGVWSEHAYGRAIDVNPIENPYVTESGYVSPPAGAPYANRSHHRPGMIHRGGPVMEAFASIGWEWGGNWPWPRDYQHFSATGH